MKEDIEIIEKMLNRESSIYKRNRRGNKEIKFEVNSNYYKAIGNLLTRYKQLEEENKEIKKEFAINTEIHKRDKIIKDLKETINCLHETDKENYIPKLELKNDLKYMKNAKATGVKQLLMKKGIIGYLQELLREE